ncbi:enoyl-CoA hydratase/isomerase family protein [Rhodococcus sp. HNM0569]|uniref:enoyl-CoA hydratase-related protein n=1 Tax=Rhodococcus sp. HNM0569 TaxID=2716340 RepID=UPI00146BDD7B|nr:enoyl-CoA hydratase/isomerase family protein [Rhodococcus sp. HNM0569]
MSDRAVVVDRDGPVATITLDRAERKNALTPEMYRALLTTFDALGTDPDVRAVVLTGAGGNFCSGADLGAPAPPHPIERMRLITAVATALTELPKPKVAAIEGYAVGAGWNLALLCDLVVAASDAQFIDVLPAVNDQDSYSDTVRRFGGFLFHRDVPSATRQDLRSLHRRLTSPHVLRRECSSQR